MSYYSGHRLLRVWLGTQLPLCQPLQGRGLPGVAQAERVLYGLQAWPQAWHEGIIEASPISK